jgi:SAM-dependent methyltransferase
MRQSVREFVEIAGRWLPIKEPIYEFGSYQVLGQEKFVDLRSLFRGKKFIGADIRKGNGVDVVLDLHNIGIKQGTAGTVLILDTLEHVEFPRKAVTEAHRILCPDGLLIMTSIMNFPIHNFPHDFWRFTPTAFKSLLSPFECSVIKACGDPYFPHILVGIGFREKETAQNISQFNKEIEKWCQKWRNPCKGDTREILKQFFPPVLCRLYREFKSWKD